MKSLSYPTIKRLPVYLDILKREHQADHKYMSTSKLIDILQMPAVTVRKDLASIGISGKPKVGYELTSLISAIEEALGWNRTDSAFLVGAGSLGSALLGYKGFEQANFHIVAAFDTDQTKVDTEVNGKTVFHISKLPNLAERMKIKLAVITTPDDQAQETADLLVDAGIKGIWNFTGRQLSVPDNVVVHNENLNAGLALFLVKVERNEENIQTL